MQKDQYSNLTISQSIAPQAVSDNTALVGALIDGADYESLTYGVSTGTLTTAAATFTASLQEGDKGDGSDLAAVAAADILGALPVFDGTKDNSTFKFGYRGTKRYTKLTITPAGNLAAATIGANAILGHYRHAPAP